MTISSIYVQNNVQDYLSAKSWLGGSLNTIQLHGGAANWSDWLTSPGWEAQQFVGQNVNIMWSIPLIPYGANLATAATGAYNNNYLALAKQMVANSHNSDQIYVRVGWEFNGKDWNSSSAVGHADDYIAAYRAFVDTFRSVSSKFVFEWTPNIGPTDMNPETAYPGDKYVDVIGTDLYYNTQWDSKDPQQAFNWFVKEQYGLQWQQDFATAHGKPTAIAEWGINSDSPQFIELMAKWMSDHNMLYQSYWDSNAAFEGKLSADQYPNAAAAFEKLFGAAQTSGVSNVYNGTAGVDTLSGSTGGDVLTGAAGNDTYYINHTGDRIVELDHGGNDTAIASVSYTLDAYVENLTLAGTGNLNGTGNDQANLINGNSGANVLSGAGGNDTVNAGDGSDKVDGGSGDDKLYGNGGNDTLDGGAGSDYMNGGDGDDTYYVDSTGDVIVEAYNGGLGGVDTVYASIGHYALPGSVENLIANTTGAVNFIGNNNNNVITGAGGNDTLNGGDGLDTLHGGNGDDKVSGGTGADVLYGDAGNDTLDGGTGIDHLEGGDGDDTYYVDTQSDVVVELSNNGLGGVDTVYASSSYTLSDNVENLLATGSASVYLTGNSGDNIIHGNDGNNAITGGAGNDTLYGGAGKDTFIFALGFGRDVIQDFSVGDKIDLSAWYASGKTPVVTMSNGDTFVTFDADDSIKLTGVASSHLHATTTGFVFQ